MSEAVEFAVICFVLNDGQASKALRIAKKYGVKGGTICLGHGTVKNKLLEILELNDTRKELLWSVAGKQTAFRAVEAVAKEMCFHKPHHGIAFIVPIVNVAGMTMRKMHPEEEHEITTKNEVLEEMSYHLIFTVADKGKAEEAVEAAKAAGAGGATIINARGSGLHETDTLFAMQIEPEKEMVLIVSESDATDAIVKSIGERLKIDEPGNGVIFVTAASAAVGLRQKK